MMLLVLYPEAESQWMLQHLLPPINPPSLCASQIALVSGSWCCPLLLRFSRFVRLILRADIIALFCLMQLWWGVFDWTWLTLKSCIYCKINIFEKKRMRFYVLTVGENEMTAKNSDWLGLGPIFIPNLSNNIVFIMFIHLDIHILKNKLSFKKQWRYSWLLSIFSH